jgi:hypothetical protein
MREQLKKQEADRHTKRQAALKAKRSKADRASKHTRNVRNQELHNGLQASFKAAEDLIAEDERQGNYAPGDTSEEEDE